MGVLRLGLYSICMAAPLLVLVGSPAIAKDASPDPDVVYFISGELAPQSAAEESEVGEDSTAAAEEDSSDEQEPTETGKEQDDVSGADEADIAEPPEVLAEGPEQEVSAGLAVLEEKELEEEEEIPRIAEPGRFFGPLPTRNQHPLRIMFYDFTPERAKVLPAGESEFVFRFQGSSNMVKKTEAGTIVDLDLECWAYELEHRWGSRRGELTVTLPFRDNTHGFMDNIIDSWHGFLGLPRGNRPDYPANDYHFFVRNRYGDVLNIASDRFGLGDLSIAWKGESGSSGSRDTLSYRAAVKLPTGDSEYGLGSGGTDAGIGLAYERLWYRWAGYANLNYIVIGTPDFVDFEANNIWTGCVACEYRLRPTWWLTGQVNFAQYPLTTGVGTLDRDSQELLFGFHKLLGKRLLFSGGFFEDMRTDTGPDFGIIGEFRWRF